MIEYTVKVYPDGSRVWYVHGKRHREDGPAWEWADGTRQWYVHGKRHREDGPAIEWANGSRSWWVDGKLHREDGPAFEWADGTREWYVHGKKVSEAEHARLTSGKSEALRRVEAAERELAEARRLLEAT